MNEGDTRVPLILGVVIPLLLLTFTIVLLRVYTRAVLLKQFGADDVWAVLSMVFLTSCAFGVLLGIKYGFGRHQVFLSEDDIRNCFKSYYVSIILYPATLGAIKTTLLCQYYRAFATKMRTILIVSMILVSAWSISQIFLAIFICTPTAAFWDRNIHGKCLPKHPMWYITAAGNIVTDIVIIVIPLPVVINLKLARRQRCVLVAVFCLGFLTCAIAIVRILHLNCIHDIPWENVDLACWSFVELCCGLLCACVPTLRPFFSKYFPTLPNPNRWSKTFVANSQPEHNTSSRGHDTERQHRHHVQDDLLQGDVQPMRILCVSEFNVTEERKLAISKLEGSGER